MRRNKKMKKLVPLCVALFMFVVTAFPAAPAAAKTPKIMEFDTMAGVPRPYTGSANPIRGINGGGVPWVISFAQGELNADGKLELKVMGLVLDPNDPQVIAGGRGGTNPAANFRAVVSCLSKDSAGAPTTVNVFTDPFPATPTGDAQVEAQLTLPSPCIAPIIFVTNGGGTPPGSWFAATGL
jgi:hypothetical protein